MRRILFLLALAACSRTPAEPGGSAAPPAASGNPSAAAAPTSPATRGPHEHAAAAQSLQWDDPSRWQRRKPSSAMRAAEYTVPRAAGDSDDAECTVFNFGPGQGGSADDNINRWVKQLQPATSPPVRTSRKAHGMAVSRVEVAGTFTPMKMPGGPPVEGPRSGWRLIGFVVEAPTGPWFFKMTGPDATVKAAAKDFDAMIDSAHPADPSPKPSN